MASSTPPLVPEAPNPRKRGRTACTRCKTRKQRCDDQWPICSNCSTAGVQCDKKRIANDGPSAAYTQALEDRVVYLENKISQMNKQQQDETSRSPVKPAGSNHALPDIVTIIPLESLDAPAYVGSSSGISLAANLQELVQSTVWNKALYTANLPGTRAPLPAAATDSAGDFEGSRLEATTGVRAITLEELAANSTKEPPSDVLGARLLNTYFTQLHPRYPFLNRSDIWDLHSQRMELAATPPIVLSMPKRFGVFKLYMVYAIGAALIQLTEKDPVTPSESLYMTALQHISAARESRTIQNIEAMVLLVIYHLRSASSHGMWYMIGLAMRTCIDLGMHRRGHERGLAPEAIQRRRLVYWCVYALERTIAVSLGRPLSISDEQVDVDMPLETMTGVSSSPPGFTNATSLAIQLFKVRRIESHIHQSIYRVDMSLELLRPELDRLYRELTAWWTSVPIVPSLSATDMDYLRLHFNRVLRLLIQPFLAILPCSDPFYTLCLRAAGDICQVHKKLHQTPHYGHSFISVQTVFVAGITLIYGLWTQTQTVWSVALANDIRACSLVLFVMSERAPSVKKFRDAFEMLVTAAMEKLEGGNSSPMDIATAVQKRPIDRHGGPNANSQQDNAVFEDRNMSDRCPNNQDDAWRMVVELANWIDHEDGSAVWMPDFELLQNLPGN